MITSGGLRYFYESATLGSMRLASDKLGIAVSSISRQIAQLEQQLGVQLFERGLRVIRLTEAGQLVLDYQRRHLSDEETLLGQLSDLKTLKAGKVPLVTGDGFLGRHFTDLLDRFSVDNPGLEIDVQVSSTSNAERAVLDDEAQIGLIMNAASDPKIRVRAMYDQPLTVVLSPQHPSAHKESFTLADLQPHALCLPPRHFRFRRMLAEAEVRSQTWLSAKMTLTSIELLSGMARTGGMITILPPATVYGEVMAGELLARPLVEPEIGNSAVSLIYRQGRILDPASLKLIAMLEHHLRVWATYHQG